MANAVQCCQMANEVQCCQMSLYENDSGLLTQTIIHDYTLQQQTLENVQSAIYLGITITENMDWGQHISDISSKATKTLGFLRRNLAFAPRSTKEVAYKPLVRPKLENAAPIWSPYCKTQIQQVKKVQRTAARWT